MRAVWILLFVCLISPRLAGAQSSGPAFSIHAAAGPTLVDAGQTVAASVGFSPWSRVTFLADFQRTQLSSRIDRHDGVSSAFRGGTVTAVSGEVRVALRPADRVSPYVLAGYGRGEGRPNVNETFPNPVKNDVGFAFLGAGIRVPVRERLSLVADVRGLLGVEGTELLGMYPVRVGVAWRF